MRLVSIFAAQNLSNFKIGWQFLKALCDIREKRIPRRSPPAIDYRTGKPLQPIKK